MAWCGAIGSVLLPVVTVPAGVTPAGLPAGVQIIGPFLSDLRLLRIAEIVDTRPDRDLLPRRPWLLIFNPPARKITASLSRRAPPQRQGTGMAMKTRPTRRTC